MKASPCFLHPVIIVQILVQYIFDLNAYGKVYF